MNPTFNVKIFISSILFVAFGQADLAMDQLMGIQDSWDGNKDEVYSNYEIVYDLATPVLYVCERIQTDITLHFIVSTAKMQSSAN